MIEHVNGTIIGSFLYPYRFYCLDGRRLTSRALHFANDAEAEAWVKANYSDEYKVGVEMRCYGEEV